MHFSAPIGSGEEFDVLKVDAIGHPTHDQSDSSQMSKVANPFEQHFLFPSILTIHILDMAKNCHP